LAFEGLAGTALVFAGLALAFCPHCFGVIASIVLLLLLLALHWHHHPHCTGTFALLRCRCCPCCLCIAASIANWRLPNHKAVSTRAGIIASNAPLLLPA
jgi:hypothetical protein